MTTFRASALASPRLQRERRRVLRIALLLPWPIAGCERAPGSEALVKLVPPDAAPLQDRGAFELAVQQCELDLRGLLGSRRGARSSVARYRVAASVGWPALDRFYAAQLPPPIWRERADVPERQAGFRVHVRERDAASGVKCVAVALLDDVAVGMKNPEPFRVLVLGSSE
jgi:hypothetical protein